MAENKEVNPMYEVDVDTMMIEYVLYNAVKSHLALLKLMSVTQYPRTNIEGASEAARISAEATGRLTEVYQILVDLFKSRHGLETLSETARIDADVLIFLTLINKWVGARVEDLGDGIFHLAPSMQTGLRCEQLINHFMRQRWLEDRGQSDTNKMVLMIEPHKNWYPHSSQVDHVLPEPVHLQDHLIPRFLHVSCKIQPLDAELSEKWMGIASRFMIQAAIEVMHAPDFLEVDISVAQTDVEECFAWGYVIRDKYSLHSVLKDNLVATLKTKMPVMWDSASEECKTAIDKALELEDGCLDMFHNGGSGDLETMELDGLEASDEVPDWTRVRQEVRDIALTTLSAVKDEEEDPLGPVRFLQNQYRLSTLLTEIAEFLETSWGNYHAEEWQGRPILTQIEEGGIRGMTHAEFESFKQHAGIANVKWSTEIP